MSESDNVVEREALDRELREAAEALLMDYCNDDDLTIFIQLDGEAFVEEVNTES